MQKVMDDGLPGHWETPVCVRLHSSKVFGLRGEMQYGFRDRLIGMDRYGWVWMGMDGCRARTS